jgi:hypothetical protein
VAWAEAAGPVLEEAVAEAAVLVLAVVRAALVLAAVFQAAQAEVHPLEAGLRPAGALDGAQVSRPEALPDEVPRPAIVPVGAVA